MELRHPMVKLMLPDYPIALGIIAGASKICYGKTIDADNINHAEWEKYVKARLDAGHESVIEHVHVTALIVCDRGVSHELVRHRLASYTQASTRFIDGSKGDMPFIIPCWCNIKAGIYGPTTPVDCFKSQADAIWFDRMLTTESDYNKLRLEWAPEQARSILPNSLATVICITANLREWRHILALRAKGITGRPHPQMRQIMYPIWLKLHETLPVFFDEPDEPMFKIQGSEDVEVYCE